MASDRRLLLLDNGASTIKAGLATNMDHDRPRIFPNNLARSKGEKRTFVADEIDDAQDLSALNHRSAFDRGYQTGWETEKLVWDRVLSQLAIEPEEHSLFLTETYNNPRPLQDATDQMVFEYWGFQSLYRCTPASIVAQAPGIIFEGERESGRSFRSNPECVLLVDMGYSFTHILPFMKGQLVQSGVRRIDVGGKLLTNHLKTLISFRQWNMMDETHIVNEVKEKTCFVSKTFVDDLEACRRDPLHNAHRLDYVLPDFASPSRMHGYVKRSGAARPQAEDEMAVDRQADEQLLSLGSERFSVPEVLFNPSDIGLPQAGLAEAVMSSISSLPSEVQGLFWTNIGLFGGNVRFPNLPVRLRNELRAICPAEYSPQIRLIEDPELAPYLSMFNLFTGSSRKTRWSWDNFARLAVTKQDYDELGPDGLARAREKTRKWEARWAGDEGRP